MRLSVLVIAAVLMVASSPSVEASRTKRTIGGWFSKLWKSWKKEPEPSYRQPVYVAVPKPVYRPPPPVKAHYGPPPGPIHPPPGYGPPPGPVHPPHVHPAPSFHAPPVHVQHGGHGGGFVGGKGHGIAVHGKGGHGHGKGHGNIVHGKGGHGHGKGGDAIPHGFGPVKHSDILHGGSASHSGGYGPPPPETYGPPPVETYGPPPVETYGPPPVETYGPPPAEAYSPPPIETYAPPPAESYSAPPVIEDSYSAPSVPVVVDLHGAPPVSEPSNDYRAPPSFPPPMAAHGSSSSSYLEGSFQPSQPLPEGPVIAPALPAPPAPLYDLPIGPHSSEEVFGGAPAPIHVLPPAPLALETEYEAPIGTAGGSLAAVTTGSIASALPVPGGSYEAPALDLTYGSKLGPEDPIIEIVFQDADPLPAPPPPVIDPELYALQDEDVEVYFIEYSPGDNIDDIAALQLDGAQPAVLHDLPRELPVDIRSRLADSGILDDAEIQVVDLDDALASDLLDFDTRTALEAAYGAESRLSKAVVPFPQNDVGVKVHRLSNEHGSPESTAELLARLQNYREGRFVGLVKSDSNDTDKYLPLTVDGERLPLPNSLNLEGQKVAEVLVVAANNGDVLDIDAPPPANSDDPEHNIVAEASNLKPVIIATEVTAEGSDRKWHGDPNDWRPVWN